MLRSLTAALHYCIRRMARLNTILRRFLLAETSKRFRRICNWILKMTAKVEMFQSGGFFSPFSDTSIRIKISRVIINVWGALNRHHYFSFSSFTASHSASKMPYQLSTFFSILPAVDASTLQTRKKNIQFTVRLAISPLNCEWGTTIRISSYISLSFSSTKLNPEQHSSQKIESQKCSVNGTYMCAMWMRLPVVVLTVEWAWIAWLKFRFTQPVFQPLTQKVRRWPKKKIILILSSAGS